MQRLCPARAVISTDGAWLTCGPGYHVFSKVSRTSEGGPWVIMRQPSAVRACRIGFDPGHADADGTGIRFAGPPTARAALSNIASSGRTAPSGSTAVKALKSSPVPAAISAICT